MQKHVKFLKKRLPRKAEDWENNHKQVRVCLWVRSMAWIITFPTERQFPDKITISFSPRPLRINFFLLDYMALSWKPYTLALKPTRGRLKKWMLIVFAFLTDNMRWVRKNKNKIKGTEHQDLLQSVWLIEQKDEGSVIKQKNILFEVDANPWLPVIRTLANNLSDWICFLLCAAWNQLFRCLWQLTAFSGPKCHTAVLFLLFSWGCPSSPSAPSAEQEVATRSEQRLCAGKQ